MINPNYDYLFQDFLDANKTIGSDNTFLLRSLLSRGSSEAYRRFFLTYGDKSREYRSISYYLEDLAISIESYMDDHGTIKPEYRALIIRAVTLSHRLFILDAEETIKQCEAALEYLTADLCEDCRDHLLAA